MTQKGTSRNTAMCNLSWKKKDYDFRIVSNLQHNHNIIEEFFIFNPKAVHSHLHEQMSGMAVIIGLCRPRVLRARVFVNRKWGDTGDNSSCIWTPYSLYALVYIGTNMCVLEAKGKNMSCFMWPSLHGSVLCWPSFKPLHLPSSQTLIGPVRAVCSLELLKWIV